MGGGHCQNSLIHKQKHTILRQVKHNNNIVFILAQLVGCPSIILVRSTFTERFYVEKLFRLTELYLVIHWPCLIIYNSNVSLCLIEHVFKAKPDVNWRIMVVKIKYCLQNFARVTKLCWNSARYNTTWYSLCGKM